MSVRLNTKSPVLSTPSRSPTPSPSVSRSSTPIKTRSPSPVLRITPNKSSPKMGDDSPMLDPYQTSRIPGAKPPKPDKPPKPRNLLLMTQKSNESPEWLTFSEKKRRFEQGSKTTTESQSSSQKNESYSESKRFSYLSADELERLKEEEAKKLASFSEDQIKSMMNAEEEDDDEEAFDQFISEETTEVIDSDNQRVFRTAKAERRYKERLKKGGFEMDLEFEEQLKNLTPNQRRALEAEKRALWRQARLKSLEDDAMKAQMVMARVKEMSEQMEARPVSPKMQVIDIDIDVDNSNGISNID